MCVTKYIYETYPDSGGLVLVCATAIGRCYAMQIPKMVYDPIELEPSLIVRHPREPNERLPPLGKVNESARRAESDGLLPLGHQLLTRAEPTKLVSACKPHVSKSKCVSTCRHVGRPVSRQVRKCMRA